MIKRVLFVAAGAYILGFVGTFIVTWMNYWEYGPVEAALRSMLWPYEIVKLFQ